jgi:hypothetical protein
VPSARNNRLPGLAVATSDIVAVATSDIVAVATSDIVAVATSDIVAAATSDIVAAATSWSMTTGSMSRSLSNDRRAISRQPRLVAYPTTPDTGSTTPGTTTPTERVSGATREPASAPIASTMSIGRSGVEISARSSHVPRPS